MKKILLSLFVLAITSATNAQIETPAPSPSQKIEQKVGLTNVIVDYSRPSMRGRKIFGGLEQYGEVWRTGANARTKITFSSDVTIDGKSLKKGTYAIFTKPGKASWDVYFYTEHEGSGAPRNWDESKVAAQIRVTPQTMPMDIETFTITFDDLTKNSAVLGLLWEKTYVGIKFETPTDALVAKSIEKVMSGPSANDMFGAAGYYLEAGKDINKAQTWIDKAVEMTADNPRFWYLRLQSLVHAKAGKTKSAIAAARESLKHAKIAKNSAYIKMNETSLKEWGAM